MMVETAVEIARCGACGAEVRDESLFCYNCGAAIVKESPGSEAALEDLASAEGEAPATVAGSPVVENGEARPPLRSAATMRKHRRASNRQPVKISWEEPQGSPKAFVVTTIVLVLAAALLLATALYLR